jgi:hypothetical protein
VGDNHSTSSACPSHPHPFASRGQTRPEPRETSSVPIETAAPPHPTTASIAAITLRQPSEEKAQVVENKQLATAMHYERRIVQSHGDPERAGRGLYPRTPIR